MFNDKAIGYHFHPMALEAFCQRMKLTGISAVTMFKKHPELKQILLPVNGTAAGIIFSILVKMAFIEKINRKFYWYCRIVSAYLEGIKEGLAKNSP